MAVVYEAEGRFVANSPRFERGLGYMSIEEQEALNNATMAIAGVGGDGGELALKMARMGVGTLVFADPDPFEIENIQRQAGSHTENLGQNKALVIAEAVKKISPESKVIVYPEGINPENVDDFLRANEVTLLADETEFTRPEIGVSLARKARELGIANVMALNIGFGGAATSFVPKGRTLEKTLGIPETMPLDEVADLEVDLGKWLSYLPGYADLEAFKKVATGEKSAPGVAPAIAIAAGIASTESFLHIVGGKDSKRRKPTTAPHWKVFDPMDGGNIVRHPRLSYKLGLVKMLANNALGRVPKVNY